MNKAELIKALAELLAEKMEIGEEPTNGEVIQAMFPCTEVVEGDGITGVRIDTKDIGALMVLYTDWWNAPYQKGGE